MYFEARARTTKHCGIIGGEFVNFSWIGEFFFKKWYNELEPLKTVDNIYFFVNYSISLPYSVFMEVFAWISFKAQAMESDTVLEIVKEFKTTNESKWWLVISFFATVFWKRVK